MKCLWLTRKYPVPANSGELIYSHGLIRSFAGAGAEVTVIAHDNDERPVGDGSRRSGHKDEEGVTWLLGSPELGSRWRSLLSRFPSDSYRLKWGGPSELLEQSLCSEQWDAIIIDHAALGWSLDLIRSASRGTGRPSLVYVSHNHEAKVRREVARNSTASAPKKLALRYDAEKYARQENRLCREVDLVTAITATEVDAYRSQFPDQEYLELTPGFLGEIHRNHLISDETPRRVVMSGSFEWIAKRINLQRFLAEAAEPFAEAGIELQIVGKTDETFRDEMASQYPNVDFVGKVPDMSPYLLNARMGLIVEEFGGGFKLKQLDYIFHGLPIAGYFQAIDGLPLKSPEHLLLAEGASSLVNKVSRIIDDTTLLSRMGQSALDICEAHFRWEDRGKRLLSKIESMRSGTAAIELPG